MIPAANGKKLAVTAALSLAVIVCTTILIFYNQTFINGTPKHSAFERINRSQQTQKVVCMIHTTPGSWSTRGKAVRHTWGPRCTFSIYFYSNKAADPDHEIRKAKEAVGLDVEHGRDHLTAKTRAGVEYSYKKYGEVADWFMKVDDDTYLVWENLIGLLDELQPIQNNNTGGRGRAPLYVGRHFLTILPHGYNSGGAGYLLNNPAAKLFLEGAERRSSECHRDGGYEDVETGRCMAGFGVYPSNTYDEKRKLRFHCGTPLKVFDGSDNLYFIELAGATFGSPQHKQIDQMLSEKTVTFHYITPAQILMFDYLVYHLKVGDTPSRREIRYQILKLDSIYSRNNGSRNIK